MRTEEDVGFLRQRNDDKGDFDELIGAGGFIHFEMMGNDHLWIGIDHPSDPRQRVMVNVYIKGRRIIVRAEDDSDLP